MRQFIKAALLISVSLIHINLFSQVELNAGGNTTADAPSPGGNMSSSIGQIFYQIAEECGGRAQSGALQPDFPMLMRENSLSATDTSDAYVTVSWNLLEECFKDVNNRCMPYPDGILVELMAEGERIYSDIIYNANGLLSDSYRHFVGPDSTVDYTLNLFIRGSGVKACPSITTTGSTIPFQVPTNFTATAGSFPGKVVLSWVNNSQLSSSILLFRKYNGDSTLIATIPGTERVDTSYSFTDAFASNNPANLVNGLDYEYCLYTYNVILDEVLPESACTNGSTFEIGLTATVQNDERVVLSWNNVMNFSNRLKVRRDGILIATLDSTATTFTDNDPTRGIPSEYRLALVNSEDVVRGIDVASVNLPAIGQLAGFVRTPDQVGIADIPVTYSVRIETDTLRDTVLTDYRGYYSFDGVYFGRRGVFTIKPSDKGRFTFSNATLRDTLTNMNPRGLSLNFKSKENYPISQDASIMVDTVTTLARIDELAFFWEYDHTDNLRDTIHFQLFREGQLVDITDDQQAMPLELVDRTASAGYIYEYRVIAYGFKGDSLVTDDFMLFDTMPDTQAPYDLIGTVDYDANSENVMTLSWNHDSENFDGFRLYRNNELVVVLDPEVRFFYDYYAEPGAQYNYILTAFRRVLGSTDIIESESVVTNPPILNIPSLPEVQMLSATAIPEAYGVELEWSLPAVPSQYDNLTGFEVSRNGVPIKRILKQAQDYVYRDYRGVPGQNTAYAVRPFLYTTDTTYLGAAQMVSISYPAMSMPSISNLMSLPEGALKVAIDPSYAQQNNNFDGFLVTADGIPFDTLRTFDTETFYIPNVPAGIASVEIGVSAFRSVGGTDYYSAEATQSAAVPSQTGVPMDSIENFIASEHFPMHVALKWEFPDYIFATFSIYRDGVLLDTLPYTSRNYYDYEATIGKRHLYSISAEYEGSQSPVLSATGFRRGDAYLQGQLLTNRYTTDRNAVAVDLRNTSDSTFLLRTFTDSSGYFRFSRLHGLVGNGNWQLTVDATGGGHALVAETQTGYVPAKRNVLFRDDFMASSTPPLPFVDSIAFVSAIQLNPFPEEQAVVASWSLTEGLYDGSRLLRGLSEITAIDAGGRTFFMDSLGVGATTYPYSAGPFVLENGERIAEADLRSVVRRGDFPELLPVECLSGLANLNYLDNSVTLQWSHFNDKVNFYQVFRNGEPLATVSRGDSLSYIDTEGKPNQTYIYQVRAIRANNSGITASDPRTVEVVFPNVARPVPFTAAAIPDSNAVELSWSYNGNAVDGFRIFRNDIVVTDVPANSRTFLDYEGIPFSQPEYTIVALLNRDGMLYQSRPSVAQVAYPALKPPFNVMVSSDLELGLLNLSFDYRAQGIDQFRVSRAPAGGGPAVELAIINYNYNGAVQSFAISDEEGTPGISYEYQVEALSRRDGILFESLPAVSSPIVYPNPPAVTEFTASVDFSNWVNLNWMQDLDVNVDGFRIFRTYVSTSPPNSTFRDTFNIILPGKRSYQDVFFPFPELPTTNMNYIIRSYRVVDGQYYFSSDRQVPGRVANSGAPTDIFNVVATKGTYSDRTRISWEYAGNLSAVEGFNIYREEERIATLNNDDNFFNDGDGVPGRQYVYIVKAVLAGTEDAGSSDIGFSKGAGQLEGEVVTLVGNAPVEGAMLVAEGVVEGELYTYETETDNNGQFIIPDIFVGEQPVNYTLSVSFRDHGFIEPEKVFNLSPQNSIRSNIFFFDTTAYIAKGKAAYAGTNCSIDSVTVRARHILADGSVVEEMTQTNAQGEYSLVLNPFLDGLERINIVIDSIYVRNQGMQGETRILHQFNNRVRTIQLPVPQVNEFDFQDGLTYDVEIAVKNVCGLRASSNGRFDIEVSTLDGCLKRVRTTELDGKVRIPLPPLDGVIARVVGAAPLSLENNLIVNYLENRPTGLDLEVLHLANTAFNNDGDFVLLAGDTLVERTLVYHKPATITVAQEFGMRPSCDPSRPRIINQNDPYSVRFDVTELHRGIVCDVTEGYIIINNSAARDNSRDTLFYIPSTGRFEEHSFYGGSPNLVSPFRKGINLQYFSAIGDLLAEETIPVVVLGAAPLPGSDIIVDVEDEQGQVKYPIYILRDPPGDGSFSSIEEGQTVTKSITDVFSFKGGIGLELDLTLTAFSTGLYLDLEQRIGGGVDTESTTEMSFSAKQTISTSSTSDFVGPDADVMVGIGLAIQYGLVEEVRFDETTCELRKIQSFNISPNSIKTDWSYTVAQIRQIANERRSQADSVAAGSLEIQVGGNVLEKSIAIQRLLTEAQNWESILQYHNTLSVPHYQLCAKELDPDRLWAEVQFYNLEDEYKQGLGVFGEEVEFSDTEAPADYVSRVELAKEARLLFCGDPAVGSYNAQDSFLLAQSLDELIFTTDLAEKYESASRAVDYYLDSLYLSTSDVEDLISQSPSNNFIPRVENTTFSAGVTIEKSNTVKRTTSSKFSQRGFFTLEFSIGNIIGTQAEAGLGLVVETVDVENKAGVGVDLEFEWGKDFYSSREIESTVEYTFTDDDPGDQFSITAIQGRDPGHTPYFQLLGGRSSCPPEAGAIQRDRFDISLYDPATQATFDFQELRNLNPDVPATFYIQLTNLNPFGEQRDLFVFHEAESNENGAALRLNGGILGGGNQSGQTFTFINPNQPVVLPLTLTRSQGYYQFDSIYVVLRPSCTDGDLFLLGERDTVTISAFFETPCSDITISSPGNDWLISRRNPFEANSREAIVVDIRDYEPNNPNLEQIYLEYRRIGDGSGWTRVPSGPNGQLTPEELIDREYLANFNQENFGPGDVPIFPYTWDITELYNEYPDGIYEIRAIAFCGINGLIQSNIIRGEIRRQTTDVFALTEPADLVWQQGDEISIKINKDLSCSPDTTKFFVVSKTTGQTLMGQAFCDPAENKLIFAPSEPLLNFDGQLMEATAYDLNDGVNLLRDTFRWEFRVIARDFYTLDTCLQTAIYQNSKDTLRTTIFNNTSNPLINYVVENAADYPWLNINPLTANVPTAVGRRLTFEIDGTMLPVGDTTAVIRLITGGVQVLGGIDSIKVKVNVLAEPPYWVVDPSQYSTSMAVLANYELSDNVGMISRDTMDLISVWVDNEIRGVAPISATLANQYAAYMLVYGDAEDNPVFDNNGNITQNGKPLEFRIWDASEGIEYNGSPTSTDTIHFNDQITVGTFNAPEILFVDVTKDRARYIPVNGEGDGDGGLTWFSVNSEEEDNSVDAMLRELLFAENGDIIKTGDNRSAGYLEGVGWISTNGLDTLRPEEGYILFMNGVDDTIRVTGRNATYDTIGLSQGWNLVGFPLQDTLGINDALSILPVQVNDFIKTVAQDPGLPGLSNNMIAQYGEVMNVGQWLFGQGSGMEVMRPYFAYQIRVSNPAILNYPPNPSPLMGEVPVSDGMGVVTPSFNPADPSTWQVDPSEYPNSMVVTGILEIDGIQSYDQNDRVAAFVNGECRGVSPLYEVAPLGQNMATLFVYGNTNGEEIELLLYDASEDRVFLNKESLVYETNGIAGNFSAPYVFKNQTITVDYEIEHTYCDADAVGSILVSLVNGLDGPYDYEWSTGAATEAVEGLLAGSYIVTITGQLGLQITDTVIVQDQQVKIPMPEVESSVDDPACQGADLVFFAVSPVSESSIQWYDTEGNWIQEGEALLVEGITSGYQAFAYTDYNGCLSEPAEASVEIYQPAADFELLPEEDITTETMIEFTPAVQSGGYTYQWKFGDGNSSEDIIPVHQYELPGLYSTTLDVVDEAGCNSETNTYNLFVEAATHTLELETGTMSLEAIPNPFNYILRAEMVVPKAGNYGLVLRDMQGRLVSRENHYLENGKHLQDLKVNTADGVYLLSLENQEGARVVIPVVKQSIRP